MKVSRRAYGRLRRARVAVSLAVAAAGAAAVIAGCSTFLSRWQIVPAILACSVGWLALWLAVTALAGRVYCSTVCPIGTLSDICARFSPRRRRGYFYHPPSSVRIAVLTFVITAGVLGLSAAVGIFDPAAAWTRIAAYLGAPLLRGTAVALSGVVAALVTLAVVTVLAWLRGRLLCNTLCPVGTLLGIVSRYALIHPEIDTDKCLGCNRCVERCKASCINPADHTVDLSRCVMCLDCVAACPSDALTLRRGRKDLRMPLMQPLAPGTSATTSAAGGSAVDAASPRPINRRRFMLVATGAAMAANLRATAPVPALESQPLNPVTPPGRRSAALFKARCTGCGACTTVCPTQIIVPSVKELGIKNALHPVLDFNRGPCLYDCTACTEVCPTDALEPISVAEKHLIAIGKARLIPENCIEYTDGIPCGECVRRCPRRAITIITEGHRGRRLPLVDFDACIGCGTCRYVCPATPRAFVIEGTD